VKILVIGAGVIGTIYGGRLSAAGHDVTMLARGRRLAEIDSEGLRLEDVIADRQSEARVGVIATTGADDRYDLIVVAVRERQLDGVLPLIERAGATCDILFLLNCPLRVSELVARFGIRRAWFGFPGAGGVHAGSTVRYSAVAQQPTTFGPVAGQGDGKARDFAGLFRGAGFATSVVSDMEAWLKTHAFLIAAICGALYRNGGVSAKLAGDRDGLALLSNGVREGFRCVQALGFKPSPPKLRFLVTCLPAPLLLRMLKKFFSSRLAKFVVDGHATAAPDDMLDLADDCRKMIATSGIVAPNMERLCASVEHYCASATLGSAARDRH
jgi:2-dehydropantoate 2-reductase